MRRRGGVHKQETHALCAWRRGLQRLYRFGLDRVIDRDEEPDAVARDLGLRPFVLEQIVAQYYQESESAVGADSNSEAGQRFGR